MGLYTAQVECPRYARTALARLPAEADLRSLDEATLVQRAVGSRGIVEPEAMGVLYERHARDVFAFAFKRLHDPAQSEDVTAQTFLQVLRAMPRYQPRGVPIRSWFLTIAANVIRDMYRKGTAPRRAMGIQGYGSHPGRGGTRIVEPRDSGAEAAITAFEDAEALDILLGTLPSAQRDVLRYRFVADLSIAETARCMGRSEGAIRMLQIRALKALRQAME